MEHDSDFANVANAESNVDSKYNERWWDIYRKGASEYSDNEGAEASILSA